MAAETISTSKTWDFNVNPQVQGVLLSRRTGVGKHNSTVYDILVHGTGTTFDGEQCTVWANKVLDERLINLPTKSNDQTKGIGTYVYISYDGIPPGKTYKVFTVKKETDYNGEAYLQRTAHRPYSPPVSNQAAPAQPAYQHPVPPVAPAPQAAPLAPAQPTVPAFLVLPTMRNYQNYLVNTQGQFINQFGSVVAPQQAIAIQSLSPEVQVRIPAYGVPAANTSAQVTPSAPGAQTVPGSPDGFNDDLPF